MAEQPVPAAPVAVPAAAVVPAAAPAAAAAPPARPRNRIQVSREKRPLYFFIGLAKKFLVSEDEVELSGLGLAVTTVVTVAEILKNSGHVTISKIATSLVDMQAEGRSSVPKAKIQIWIRKSPNFDQLVHFVDNTRKDTTRAVRAPAPAAAAAAATVLAPAAAKPAAAKPAAAKPAAAKPAAAKPAPGKGKPKKSKAGKGAPRAPAATAPSVIAKTEEAVNGNLNGPPASAN